MLYRTTDSRLILYFSSIFCYVLTCMSDDTLRIQTAFFEKHPGARNVFELFDFIPGSLLYVKDLESRFVHVNQAHFLQSGLENKADILGKTDRDFHPPALAEAYRAEDRRVMESGEALPNQVWLVIDARGTPQWWVSSKTPLRDPSGHVIGIAGVRYRIETPEEHHRTFHELSPVLAHMVEHFRDPIPMSEMAELAGLSATHFNRRFRELLRMSPTQYLHSLRVQEAQRQLSLTQKSIAEIAHEVGFYDQSHFTKRFRAVTGITPRKYRAAFR